VSHLDRSRPLWALGQEVGLVAILDSYPRERDLLLDGLVPYFAGAREGPIRKILDTLSCEDTERLNLRNITTMQSRKP
jgi:hypothetical protein